MNQNVHRLIFQTVCVCCLLSASCAARSTGEAPVPDESAPSGAPVDEQFGVDEASGDSAAVNRSAPTVGGTDSHTQPTGAETHAPENVVPVPSSQPVAPEGGTYTACGEPPPGSSCVEAGYFVRGSDSTDFVCEQSGQPRDEHQAAWPEQRIWVDTVYMDRTEVTNEAYGQCVAAGICEEDGPAYRDFDAPTQPITGTSWYNAVAYCRAMGRHLPTEAEWEKAARGPDGELNPWGDAPASCENAIIQNDEGRACGVNKRGSHPENGRVWEVASRPAWRYDLHDMVGNAGEWVLDWWSRDYAECGDSCSEANPRGPCGGDETCPQHRLRVVRGSSWYWPTQCATGTHRRRHVPSNDPMHHFGFRCAASVEEAAAIARGDYPMAAHLAN